MPLRPKRTTIITIACISFLAGLWLAHAGFGISPGFAAGIIVIGIIALYRKLWLVVAVIALLSLGWWRGDVAVRQAESVRQLFGQKVQLVGEVADDPVVSDKNYTEFSLRSQLPGTVKVRTYYARLQRGYRVSVEGKLEAAFGNQTAQIGFASNLQTLSTEQTWLERLRQRFFSGMRNALPEPLSSFGLGLLMGTRALIPKQLQDQLALVGLSHLVAVSGYNLTIMVDAARFRRGSAFVRLVLPLWLVGTFCLITGFSASIVRAAVVSVLSLVAAHYGRRFKPLVLLGLAAVLTTFYQPSYLWADLGWQLSFLAFFGILVVAPAVQRWWHEPHPVLAVGIESLAAQIMTAPLIVAVFGTVSLVAPFTNLLVLPLIPLAMLMSLVAGLGGMLLPHQAYLIGLPANWLLQAIVGFIQRSSTISWAGFDLSLSVWLITLVYVLVAVLVLMLERRYNSHKALGLQKP